MKKTLLFSSIAFFFIACNSNPTKVIVMTSGNVTAKENTISLEPGNTHNEVTLDNPGESITVKFEGKDLTFKVEGPGLHILNLKKDTIAGSYQRLGEGANQGVITQDQLVKKIDSLNQLIAGTNVSKEARNFSIPPFAIQKISDNGKATVVGPFLRMPATFAGGEELEVYKFYTNKELKEVAEKLVKMGEPAKSEE